MLHLLTRNAKQDMLRKSHGSPPGRRRSRKQACRVWLSRRPHKHLESDMKEEEELQKDMAKNEAKSGPLSLCRAGACSGKAKSHHQTDEGAGSRHARCC